MSGWRCKDRPVYMMWEKWGSTPLKYDVQIECDRAKKKTSIIWSKTTSETKSPYRK